MIERPKVLMISGSFPPMKCGVGDYAQQLALSIARRPDVRLAVLTSRAAAGSRHTDQFDFFPVMESWRFREIRDLRAVIREWRPDAVHIQYPTQGYGARWLPWMLPLGLHFCSIPVIQTWHEIYPARVLPRFVMKAVVPGGLVVVREGYRQQLARYLRWTLHNKTMRTIPNASAIPAVELSDTAIRDIRGAIGRPGAKLIMYFGFIFPPKGVELLFSIADPAESHLVLIGEMREGDAYHDRLRDLAGEDPWKGKVTVTGFLPAEEAARLMAAADAVVLPFLGGGGHWNTSIHGAQRQGTFVLTTSVNRAGYSADDNTYYARPGDVAEMRRALSRYAGTRAKRSHADGDSWDAISESHVRLYREVLTAHAGGSGRKP